MAEAVVASYGTWQSPISAAMLVERAVGFSYPDHDGDAAYWTEARPNEGGRLVIVRRTADGAVTDVLPAGFAARTLVHEYGGRCHVLSGGWLYFSNFADQRLWRIPVDGSKEPEPVAPEPPEPLAWRYADPVVSPDGRWLVCVRERHLGAAATDVINELVLLATDGTVPPRVIASGRDFYAAPRLSPDGGRLAWLCWDHPNMPWDGTELWVAAVDDVEAVQLGAARRVAGGPAESISQPRWSPDGVLHYVSDRTGWWNIYAGDTALCQRAAEFSNPDWMFGQSTYAFLDNGGLVAAWSSRGASHLGIVRGGDVDEIATPYTTITSVVPAPGGALVLAGSATEPASVVHVAVPSGEVVVLKRSQESTFDRAFLSVPEAIEFPTEGERTAHGLFYPPANPDVTGPDDERPPLVVMSHGGPTSAATSLLNLAIQYWTSRGIAVVDVNYGGSTGYGRAYRERLTGTWGITDVDDCVNAARWLAAQGRVDGDRMVIRGGSAGGYTTLCALTFRPGVFAAGASHFGVADAAALARDTHKFESRYLDGLIGPYPEAEDVYQQRSPIHHTDRLSVPLVLFQGLEDKVVLPSQAEVLVAALRAKGIPFAYLAFEGEQHGFRRAENIVRVAEAELWFYGYVLGFTPADDIQPVRIENDSADSAGLPRIDPATARTHKITSGGRRS